MNEKQVVILFFVLIALGIGGVVANKLKDVPNITALPSPTPTPINLKFTGQSTDTQNQVSGTITSVMPTPTPKVPKTYRQFPGELSASELSNKKAVIETNKGTIEFEVYPEATKAASNFIFLARDGFFDSLTFHRVEPGFVIQGGDPIGDGSGGPGYTFKEDKVVGKYDRGIVAMAKRSDEPAGTGGSQFFIMLADKQLPLDYVIFGKVISGMDVVDKIQVGDVMKKILIQSK